jgi:hypothetical protein
LRSTIRLVGMVAAGCLVTPSESAAQTSAPAGSLPAARIPSVMISAGLGTANGPRGPDVANSKPMPTMSVQFLPARHLVVEGEFGWWEETWDFEPPGSLPRHRQVGRLEGWVGGVNLLYRTEPRRVSVFAGGGPFLDSEHYADRLFAEGCVATGRDECWGPYEYEHRHTYLRFQAVTGVDVQIAGPLRAYGSIQFITTETGYLRTFGGVRFVAISRRAAPPGRKR